MADEATREIAPGIAEVLKGFQAAASNHRRTEISGAMSFFVAMLVVDRGFMFGPWMANTRLAILYLREVAAENKEKKESK